MATRGNVRYKSSWVTGIVYAIVTAVVAVLAAMVAIYYTMPDQLTVMIADRPFDVFITEEFYGMSRNAMLTCAFIPAVAYLWMYSGYVRLAGEHPEIKNDIKKGKMGNPWVLPVILEIVLLLLWGFVSWVIISKTLLLNLNGIGDRVMFQRFILAFGITMAVDVVMFVIGTLLFKPSLIQTA